MGLFKKIKKAARATQEYVDKRHDRRIASAKKKAEYYKELNKYQRARPRSQWNPSFDAFGYGMQRPAARRSRPKPKPNYIIVQQPTTRRRSRPRMPRRTNAFGF